MLDSGHKVGLSRGYLTVEPDSKRKVSRGRCTQAPLTTLALGLATLVGSAPSEAVATAHPVTSRAPKAAPVKSSVQKVGLGRGALASQGAEHDRRGGVGRLHRDRRVAPDQGEASMPIGEQIKNLRKERGWSQADLATKINGDAGHISRYENGKITPSVEAIVKFAELFDVSVDYLLVEDAPRRRSARPTTNSAPGSPTSTSSATPTAPPCSTSSTDYSPTPASEQPFTPPANYPTELLGSPQVVLGENTTRTEDLDPQHLALGVEVEVDRSEIQLQHRRSCLSDSARPDGVDEVDVRGVRVTVVGQPHGYPDHP